ncbi:hypothetical protein BGX27_006033 [Mortierella sp. AM989]|nr:hypothetical protein BGX27_006033 [Mortierella sp. AM989]
MDVYVRYVSWTIENYPQGGAQGHDSRLVSLLEQAIVSFKDDERYKNDPRFVKLLVLYSEKVEFPMDVFNFMETNRIGSEISMYYEEHADYLESREEFEKAKDVFLLGIHRRARPLGRLKRLFEEFERRADFYQKETERKAIEDSELELPHQRARPTGSTTPMSAGRRVLGNKISGSESIHANEAARGHVPISSSNSSASTMPSGKSVLSGYQRPNARLEVYSDQITTSGRTKPKHGNHSSQENTPWKELGVDQVRRKENVREATSWKGARLTAEDTVPRRPQPRLQVWCDAENTEPEGAEAHTKPQFSRDTTNSASTLVPNVQTLQESSKDAEPAHRHTTPYSTTIAHPVSSDGLDQRFPITKSDKGGKERLMIDLKQIYVDGEEFSIEEIKAKRSCYKFHGPNIKETRVSERLRSTKDTHGSARHTFIDEEDSSHHHKDIPHTSPPPPPLRHLLQDVLEDSQPSVPIKPLLPKSPSHEEREQLSSKRRLTASPTLHTKYASAEMNKIFSDRSRARRSIDSQWSNEDNKDVDVDELDRFTMAYSIPSIPWDLPLSSREFLENEVQNEYDDDDDADGGTEGFVRKLEQGFASTITQDIEALKKRRAAEDESRLSLRSNKRSSSRFDSSRRQSDITIAIQQRFQQIRQHGQGQSAVDEDKRRRSSSVPYPRTSLGQSHLGSSGLVGEQQVENKISDHSQDSNVTAQPQMRPFQVFRDDVGSLDSELNVPMLEDEAPPPFLDNEELL